MIRGETHEGALQGWAAARKQRGATFTESKAYGRALAEDASASECQALLLEHLEFIERTSCAVARRHGLSRWEADDFGGQVKLRMLADDYAILRKFRGKSQLTTYLTTVIHNLFRDHRIRQWGKWRPSAAARRHGTVGVQLESLLYRDQFTFTEAAEILRTRFGVEISEHELLEIAATIRPRTSRRFESDSALARLHGPDRGDQRVIDSERVEVLKRLESALCGAIASLGAEDRLILKMRFSDGFSIRSIAGTLDFDQRRIYARVRRILRDLREKVVEKGVRYEEVMDLLDWPACVVEAGLSEVPPVAKKRTA